MTATTVVATHMDVTAVTATWNVQYYSAQGSRSECMHAESQLDAILQEFPEDPAMMDLHDHLVDHDTPRAVVCSLDGVSSGTLTVIASQMYWDEKDDTQFEFDRLTKDRLLPANQPRFVLFDFNYSREANRCPFIVLMVWMPDAAKIREKMLYAATKDALKRQIAICRCEMSATDPSEMLLADIIERLESSIPTAQEPKPIFRPPPRPKMIKSAAKKHHAEPTHAVADDDFGSIGACACAGAGAGGNDGGNNVGDDKLSSLPETTTTTPPLSSSTTGTAPTTPTVISFCKPRCATGVLASSNGVLVICLISVLMLSGLNCAFAQRGDGQMQPHTDDALAAAEAQVHTALEKDSRASPWDIVRTVRCLLRLGSSRTVSPPVEAFVGQAAELLFTTHRFALASQVLGYGVVASPTWLQGWELRAASLHHMLRFHDQGIGESASPTTSSLFDRGIVGNEVGIAYRCILALRAQRLGVAKTRPSTVSLHGVSQASKDLAIVCLLKGSTTTGQWGPSSIATTGVGGSEEAVIFMSRALAKLGWRVHVFGDPTDVDLGLGADGVAWHPSMAYDAGRPPPVTICWRDFECAWLPRTQSTARPTLIYTWLHDTFDPRELDTSLMQRVARVFVVSETEASKADVKDDGKITVTPNGIDTTTMPPWVWPLSDGMTRRNHPRRFVYAARPERGLLVLLKLWPYIRKRIMESDRIASLSRNKGLADVGLFEPTLVIIGGVPSEIARNADAKDMLAARASGLRQVGVVDLDLVDHARVTMELSQSGFYLYPTSFIDTSCIAVMKSMALGAVPITTRPHGSALNETIGDFDLGPSPRRHHFETDTVWQRAWVDAVVLASERDTLHQLDAHRDRMVRHARRRFSWDQSAAIMSNAFDMDMDRRMGRFE